MLLLLKKQSAVGNTDVHAEMTGNVIPEDLLFCADENTTCTDQKLTTNFVY